MVGSGHGPTKIDFIKIHDLEDTCHKIRTVSPCHAHDFSGPPNLQEFFLGA